MTKSRILPVAFMAVTLAAGGAAIATAQSAPLPSAPGAAQSGDVRPVHYRGEGREQGQRQERGAHRGHKMGQRGHGDMKGGMMGRGGPLGGGMMQEIFAQVDADGDGRVIQEEVDAFRAAQVGAADVSGDGALSIEEFDTIYRALTRSRMVDLFQDIDADGDGAITDTELDARIGGVVARMDRDGDGVLSLRGRGSAATPKPADEGTP